MRPEPWTDPDDPQLDEVLRRIFDPHDMNNHPSPDRTIEVTEAGGIRHAVIHREDGSIGTYDVPAPDPRVQQVGHKPRGPKGHVSTAAILRERQRRRESYRRSKVE